MRGQRARRHVDHCGGQFAGDLVHVGNHQEQALRGGKRGAERAGLQRAMQRASRATFTLHFDHIGNRAPDVLLFFGIPLIGPLAHGRRRGNGVNGYYFTQAVCYGCGGFVAVDNRHATCHGTSPERYKNGRPRRE
jgi:hypothetical protein